MSRTCASVCCEAQGVVFGGEVGLDYKTIINKDTSDGRDLEALFCFWQALLIQKFKGGCGEAFEQVSSSCSACCQAYQYGTPVSCRKSFILIKVQNEIGSFEIIALPAIPRDRYTDQASLFRVNSPKRFCPKWRYHGNSNPVLLYPLEYMLRLSVIVLVEKLFQVL